MAEIVKCPQCGHEFNSNDTFLACPKCRISTEFHCGICIFRCQLKKINKYEKILFEIL